jgi:addiction module HigA family antidote
MSKSSTTTSRIPNPTPGEILQLEFLVPMGLSQTALARAIKVPPRRINEIVLGKRAVTADTDLRLARFFGLSEGFWMGLQSDYELMLRRRQIESELAQIKPRSRAA